MTPRSIRSRTILGSMAASPRRGASLLQNLDPNASAGVDTHLRVAELIDPPGDGYVIDAGAGHGAFTDRLVGSGYRAVAAEFKPLVRSSSP